jgi:hypothetical protein
MTTIQQVARTMQAILTSTADAAARETRFVQRRSKLTGAKFAQTLVFGWLSNPQATLEELTQTAATLGVKISPQGLDQRFTQTAAACLGRVLGAAVGEVIAAEPVVIPILQRFQGVHILDGSTSRLPTVLANVWAGCGNRVPGNEAAVKVQVRLDLSTGALRGPLLQDGRVHDRSSPLQRAPLPVGALRLADLGYFSLNVLRELDEQGVYWLSRLQAGTAVFDQNGERWDLARLLKAQPGDEVDIPIQLGARHRLACRLLAQRVSQKVADQRRRRLREEARRRGQMVSQARLRLGDWTFYVTNVPIALLSQREALVLARARWQIELLFKLWKSQGFIDEWRSAKPWRILCEIYAKLLTMLVQHWLLLVSCWTYPNRSLSKATQTVQRHALHLASMFDCEQRLCEAVTIIRRCLAAGCKINRRRAAPHTYQLLLNLTHGGLA